MSDWSLQRRLQRRVLGLVAAAWLAGSAAALVGLWYETAEVLDSALVATAHRLLALPEGSTSADLRHTAASTHIEPEADVVYQLFDRGGRLQARSPSAPAEALDPGAPDGLRDAGPWHVLTLTRGDGQRSARVAETLAHRHEVLWLSLGWLVLSLLPVLPLLAWGLRVVIARAFDALEPARREIERRAPDELHALAGHGLPRELAPWITTVNQLMARVRATIVSERTFAAHSAHEMRTPLAAARAQAQRLAAVAGDDTTKTHANALVRQLDRLNHLASRLLELARIESGVALGRTQVDLGLMVSLVVDEFGDARREGRLQTDLPAGAEFVRGDVDALGIALRNLIDNALKHAGPTASVIVAVGPGRMSVVDDGPGVAPALLTTLVRKFERGPGVSVQGSGLGLAMVETIARQSGARLDLNSQFAAGRGFSATLHFGGSDPV